MSEEFKIQLVEPKNPALHTIASVNPFDEKDVDWEKRQDLSQCLHRGQL